MDTIREHLPIVRSYLEDLERAVDAGRLHAAKDAAEKLSVEAEEIQDRAEALIDARYAARREAS